MDPTSSATGPVYTYSLSVKQNKVSGPNIQTYIEANQPGAASNQAKAAAAEAARDSSAVKGKGIADYIAAHRNVFDFAPANLAQGKSIEQYVADDRGTSSSESSASTATGSAQASGTEQGMSFQAYLDQAEGRASAATSSASSAASSAATAAQGSSAGKTIQDYFSSTSGSAATP